MQDVHVICGQALRKKVGNDLNCWLHPAKWVYTAIFIPYDLLVPYKSLTPFTKSTQSYRLRDKEFVINE
jgi:hypothetical protein